MSEKIYQLNVLCEPEFSVVCGLLGEGRADKTQIKEIYDAELNHLRGMVNPAALMKRSEVNEAFFSVLLGSYHLPKMPMPLYRQCPSFFCSWGLKYFS